MKKEQIRQMRILLLFVYAILSGLLLLLDGCTAGVFGGDEPEPPVVEGARYAVSFAPLAVAGEVESRASAVMAQGTLRLLVYTKMDAPTATPLENRMYTVEDGVLTEADGLEPMQLEGGEYVFYALSPSTANPAAGLVAGIKQGDDLLASATTATISSTGTTVSLASLAHKGSNVSFTVSRAVEGATFFSLEKPSSLTLYSQATEPATFQLGEAGGSLATSAGTTTVVLGGMGREFTRPDAAKEEYRASCPVLPKPEGTFNIAIQTQLVWKEGEQPVAYTLRAKVPKCTFVAGNTYNFNIRVKDPREQGEVILTVAPWTEYTWEDDPY